MTTRVLESQSCPGHDHSNPFTDNAINGWDVYVQRLAVYIQHKDTSLSLPSNVESPYDESGAFNKAEYVKHHHLPPLKSLDNGISCHPYSLSFY